MERRTLLKVAGVAALCTACGTTEHPTATGVVALTCPALVPGSVTDQAGAANGWTSAFVDAASDRNGLEVNFQHYAFLDDKPDVGGRYQRNQIVKGQHRLSIAYTAGRADTQPVPLIPPGTYNITQNTEVPAGSGNLYGWSVVFATYSTKNCQRSEKTGWAGTVTITRADDQTLEGSYDLTSSAGTLVGTFVAPRAGVASSIGVSGCPVQPAQSCVTG
jgi:hypothetical protein